VGNGIGPESPYALQKYTTEIETSLYSKLYGLDTVSLRYFNVYSHDQTINGPYATAISNWMHAIRNNITPHINGDGEQRRDMVNVEDVVKANIFCMEQKIDLNGTVYEVGTGTNISLNQIKEIVNKHFPDVEFEYRDPRPGDVEETRAKIGPLKSIGWTAGIDVFEGIDDCFRRIKDGH